MAAVTYRCCYRCLPAARCGCLTRIPLNSWPPQADPGRRLLMWDELPLGPQASGQQLLVVTSDAAATVVVTRALASGTSAAAAAAAAAAADALTVLGLRLRVVRCEAV